MESNKNSGSTANPVKVRDYGTIALNHLGSDFSSYPVIGCESNEDFISPAISFPLGRYFDPVSICISNAISIKFWIMILTNPQSTIHISKQKVSKFDRDFGRHCKSYHAISYQISRFGCPKRSMDRSL
jgi:hypothetical protein